jgi:hypothetical protein
VIAVVHLVLVCFVFNLVVPETEVVELGEALSTFHGLENRRVPSTFLIL